MDYEPKILNPFKVRKIKAIRTKLPPIDLERALLRLEKTGKIDGIVGSINVGLILDFYNQRHEERKKKDYNSEITQRNKYYAKLWKNALRETKS
jgi:hypothetical protein